MVDQKTGTAAGVDAAAAKRQEKKDAGAVTSTPRALKFEFKPEPALASRLKAEACALGLTVKDLGSKLMLHLHQGAAEALTKVADQHLEEKAKKLAEARGASTSSNAG